MVILFDVLARLPLRMLHLLGVLLGWGVYLSSGRYARRLQENLQSVDLVFSLARFRKLLRANISEAGKSVMELPWVWRRALDEVYASIKHCYGWEHFEAALAQNKGVIVLTPHMGCFEVISVFIAAHVPMTCMYRPPRQKFLDKLMLEARQRGQMSLVPTSLGGVRQLLKVLKRGHVIGVLPDQVPGNGEGEWAPFFKRPAYTMTLIGRLVESSGASIVMCRSERLPQGEGYALHFTPLFFDMGTSVPAQVNAALEVAIRQCPEQYLWSYNRYKVPRGASPPDVWEER